MVLAALAQLSHLWRDVETMLTIFEFSGDARFRGITECMGKTNILTLETIACRRRCRRFLPYSSSSFLPIFPLGVYVFKHVPSFSSRAQLSMPNVHGSGHLIDRDVIHHFGVDASA